MKTEFRTFKNKSYLVASMECTGEKVSQYPIVFLGGAAMSVSKVGGLLEEFAKFADVFALDLPGFGEADILHDDVGLEFYRDLLLNFTLNFGLKKINIIGSSYGSAPAILFSYAHPHRVNRLVGVGTMAGIPKMWRERFKLLVDLSLDNDKKVEFADCFSNTILNTNCFAQVNKSKVLYKILYKMSLRMGTQERMAFRYNTLRLLKHEPVKPKELCNVPALLCTGEYDHFTSIERVCEVADNFYEPTVCTIKGADHMVHIEQTEVVMDMISSFLKGSGIENVKGLSISDNLEVA